MISAKPNRWVRQRTLLRCVLALGFATAAVLVTQGWIISSSRAAIKPAAGMVEVRVAARNVPAGTVLTSGDLRWQVWPADAVGSDWQLRGRSGSNAAFVGQIVPYGLAAGAPVTMAQIASPRPGSVFAAAIRPGWRAASVAVSPAAGLAGFLEPGDRVDVLLTQIVGNRRTAQTLLTDIGVLGVDQRQREPNLVTAPMAAANDVIASAAGGPGAAPPDLVTLEVTPQQAEALAIAAELGKLSLALRGPGRETRRAAGRRWDSDVTGLAPALLAVDGGSSALAAATALPVSMPPPASAATAGGVEIAYGLSAAAPNPVEAAK